MRYVSFRIGGQATYGVVRDGGILDLGARFRPRCPDLRTYLHALSEGFAGGIPSGAAADCTRDDIRYEPVVPTPSKILCVGLNYEDHRQETGRPKLTHPTLFARFADTLTGHGTSILRPRLSHALDYEGELAVVIGKPAHRVPRDSALDVVAGYTCFNDGSVRDWQRHTSQFLPGKNFPRTAAFGPELVTPDEIDRFEDLRIETRLNGTIVQAAKLGDMIFSVADLIAYVTAFTPLAPGDVLATGTPGGVGFTREPPLFMKAGDMVEVAIEGIGRLENDVADEPELGG